MAAALPTFDLRVITPRSRWRDAVAVAAVELATIAVLIFVVPRGKPGVAPRDVALRRVAPKTWHLLGHVDAMASSIFRRRIFRSGALRTVA